LQFDLSIFNPKARSLIGLDISSSSVKMVELASDGKGGYRVERYAIEVLPRDVVSDGNIVNLEAAAESVRRAWKKLATSTRQVAIALPASHVITKKIIVAAGQRESELELLVESEANQYIPVRARRGQPRFQVVGPAPSSPDEIEVLIAASRKEKVEDRVAVAESAGLKPRVLDVESYAVLVGLSTGRGATLPEGGKGQIIALVDVGANVMNLTVLRNDQQIYAREQAFGGNQLTQDIARMFNMSFEEAEAEKRRNSLPEKYESELLRPFLEALALELSRALQFFFTSTQFNQVNHIVLAGGCAVIHRYRPGGCIADADQHRHCQSVCRHAAFRPHPRKEPVGRCFVADGGLRSGAAEIRRMIRINLLPHREEKRRARRQQFYALLGLVTVLSGLIVVLVYSIIAGYIASQEAKNDFPQEGDRGARQGDRPDQAAQAADRGAARTQGNHRGAAARPGGGGAPADRTGQADARRRLPEIAEAGRDSASAWSVMPSPALACRR
jgi:type IV pilus assembly protein PilM